MATNPYRGPDRNPRPQDPRQSAQESASVLSSYFQDPASKPKTVSPYSAPATPSGGAPAGPSALSSAPSGPAGGGSGFVNFSQYFGANAPAVQAQAEKTVQQTTGANAGMGSRSLLRQPTRGLVPGQSGSLSMIRQLSQNQADPYAGRIAQTQAQSAKLEPIAQTGDMGAGTSLFDQMLGGGVTQRAAKQEQQRLGALRASLEGEQTRFREKREELARDEAARRQQEEAQAQARAQEEADWYARQEEERRYYDQMRGQQQQQPFPEY